ncbi:MAG TPA: single-stranded-DNA-specific exonuclease RecJ [Anaerolineaceae bacterium]|nr:single-stranded-DNA-specific exonuclease RecJ [Anaerolineaceae bacterium]
MNGGERFWKELERPAVPEELRAAVGGHPLVSETLARRGLTTPAAARAFLDPGQYSPAPASDLPDLERMVEILLTAVRQRKKICVWGDFDVDGQTATTVLVETLRSLGAEVGFHIPVRATESHGVNLAGLRKEIAAGAGVILTCDTGIEAHDAADLARENGACFLISDHHDLPPTLPGAEAVVNPKRLAEGHPLRGLPGVGVAYEVARALSDAAGHRGMAEELLDLVALGIVADLAEQRGDTRYLLQIGLVLLRKNRRPGLQALLETAELDPAHLSEEHIGFILGPRLNALGRLADANPAVEFLTTSDPVRARTLAAELETLNAQRRLLCDQVFQAAQTQLEREPTLLEQPALVLSQTAWPAGVIGIVASRLVELYHRPTILFAAPAGQPARGSARSIPGLDIHAAITAQAELLIGSGGHPMAAGLAIEAERIDAFRQGFCGTVAEMLEKHPIRFELEIAGRLPFGEITPDLAQDMDRLAPYGPGNPPVTLLAPDVTIKESRTVGRNGEHLQLVLVDGAGNSQKVIWWQAAGLPIPEERFDLAYTLRASNYRGNREVQVEWVDARQRVVRSIEARPAAPRRQVIDCRWAGNPVQALRRAAGTGRIQVWGEGAPQAGLEDIRVVNRLDLAPGPSLAIWTAPPGHTELEAALEKVAPAVIHLFGQDPDMDALEPFLPRLAGLVNYTLRSLEGRADLNRLAAATAQRVETVRWGLRWLEARGEIGLGSGEGDAVLSVWKIPQGEKVRDSKRVDAAEEMLRALLGETAAYRSFFAQARMEALF